MKHIDPINGLPLMEQFRSYRKGMGFKQYTVAVTSNTSREAYLRAEGGRADPRLSSLVAWAEALGCRLVLEPITNEALTTAMNIAMRHRQFGGVGVQADPQGEQPALNECSSKVGLSPASPTAMRTDPLTTSRWTSGDVVMSNTPKTT